MSAQDPVIQWPQVPVLDSRRSRSFGGCTTCRGRRVKCDEGKPTCRMCRVAELACSGYEKSIFFRSGDDGDGPPRFRRHMFTESERQAMSDAIRAGVAPSQALGNLAEIDDKCESAGSLRDFHITRGPFGAFRLEMADVTKPMAMRPTSGTTTAVDWTASDRLSGDLPPNGGLDFDGNALDGNEPWGIPPPSPTVTLPPCSPISISAILNELEVPEPEGSPMPWLAMGDLGRVEEISDDMPWASVPVDEHQLEVGSSPSHPDHSEWPLVISRPSSVPPCISQDVPVDAVFLLKHYSTTVLMTLTPFRHSKTPWHVLFTPHVKTCLAALTLGESIDNATLCTFFATLALSAASVAGMSSSERWTDQARIYKQHAQWHALHTLQTAYVVPKVAKYKTILMALITMVQVSTMAGDRDQAETFLLETEKFIRIKGLNRRKSRKVRLLHHCYVFERFMHESSWPSSPALRSAQRKRIRLEIESCGAGAFSQDSLDFALTSSWGNLDQAMLRRKGQTEGENDLHLQIPGTWSATLYPEIFGVPEVHIFLISMILRLAKAKEAAESQLSISDFMMRAKSIERLIHQSSASWWQFSGLPAGTTDGDAAQSQRLLDLFVKAMREALAIYFHRAVYDVRSRLLQTYVQAVCDCLRQINAEESGFGAIRLLWPALVAAKEASDVETRAFFTEWLTSCARRTGASIFVETLARVQDVWKEDR